MDDLDDLARAMTDGLSDDKMEVAFNDMLFERIMKSKLTEEQVASGDVGPGKPKKKKTSATQLTKQEIDCDKEQDFWKKLKENGFEFGLDGAKGNPIAGLWQRQE